MNQVRLMKPYITFDEVEADFRGVFDSGMFTRGQHVEAFRKELAAFTGARHVHMATSATTALWVCLKMLGIGPGDEVVVSDFSFPASANVVEDMGATPVFADVSLETYNVLPDTVEALLTPRTKAVMFVDALGNPSGLHDISELCRNKGIPLIEDAACAIGSAEQGRRCGSIADLTCLSFHPRKLINTGEGGAITTDNDQWSQWLDVKLAHGANGFNGVGLDFVEFGYNFRLPELQAIMGRKQLAQLDAVIDRRNATRDAYIAALTPLGFVVQAIHPGVRYNVQSMVFQVPAACDRDALVTALRAEGVETTLGTYALSRGTYFARRYGTRNPNASRLQETTITLPCHDDMIVEQVVEAIGRTLSQSLR
jgi:dTDP-4-amino-4,6-dideoxygalactose transaminase